MGHTIIDITLGVVKSKGMTKFPPQVKSSSNASGTQILEIQT